MRPLFAHCQLGLGKLHRRWGDREQAQEHLTTAIAMYGEMGMTYCGLFATPRRIVRMQLAQRSAAASTWRTSCTAGFAPIPSTGAEVVGALSDAESGYRCMRRRAPRLTQLAQLRFRPLRPIDDGAKLLPERHFAQGIDVQSA
jgi:hypothetical protein